MRNEAERGLAVVPFPDITMQVLFTVLTPPQEITYGVMFEPLPFTKILVLLSPVIRQLHLV
jgi:hypothetical protein